MEKSELINKIKEARNTKRNFPQSFDLSVALKQFNLKEGKIEEIMTLPHGRGKPVKICGLVDKELETKSSKVFDKTIRKDDFGKLKPKDIRKLAKEYDFFVAQATIMPQIATTFGKFFGSRGKMPNPRAGCIVPPTADLEPIKKRLEKTLVLTVKKAPVLNVRVGYETQKDEDLADNIIAVTVAVKKMLPLGKENIKAIYLKLTMGKVVSLE
jgi:large subunit ribosomal protein L1